MVLRRISSLPCATYRSLVCICFTVCSLQIDMLLHFTAETILLFYFQAPVPLSIFRSNSKFDENSERCSFEYTRPITTIFCTRHDSDTIVTCAKYRCDRPRIFYTRVFWIFIEFRIRSKYAKWDGRQECGILLWTFEVFKQLVWSFFSLLPHFRCVEHVTSPMLWKQLLRMCVTWFCKATKKYTQNKIQ